MRISNLLPFVLSAGAFLVPTDLKDSVEIIEKLPPSSQSQDVTIGCDGGCPVMLAKSSKNGVPTKWTQLYEADLHATIEIKDNTVLFNGEQIWPANLRPKSLSIKQTTKGNIYEPFEGLMPISTSLAYQKEEILSDSTSMMKVHPIDIEILAIVDAVVHAESVHVRVAETRQGLALLPVKVETYVPSPYTDKCTTVWCRVSGTLAQKFNELRASVAKKIKGWRGCNGKKNGHPIPLKGGPAKFGPGSSLNHDNHGPHKTLGHHRHHRHHQGGLRRFLAGVFHTFIFPTIFGLSIGLIFGGVSWLFVNALRRMRARSQAEYIVIEQVEVEEGLAGPPKYDEIYREPQTETEDEKKELLQ